MNISTARLQVLIAALLFSTGGAAIKSADFSGYQVACLRSGIAALTILLCLPAARNGWNWRMVLVGVAYATTLTAYVVANKLTTAANAIFLEDTAPLYLLLAGPWLLKEPIRRSDLVVLVLMAAGIAMFFVGDESVSRTAPDPALGNLIAALTGLTWAATLAGLRWIGRDDASGSKGMATVAIGSLVALVCALPFAWPFPAGGAEDWIAVTYLGTIQVGLGYVFLTRGVHRVPALETSLIILAEPVFTPIWAYLLHGEHPSYLSLAGGGLILCATLVPLFRTARRAPF